MKVGSLVIAMRKQYDADLLHRYLSYSTILRVELATSSLSHVLNYCRDHSTCLAVCDANFSRLKAFAVMEQIRSAGQITQILFLDEQYNPSRARMAQIVQAAYCPKSEGLDKVLEIIEQLANENQRILTTSQSNSFFIDAGNRLRIDCPVFSELSNRELEVLTIIAEGHSVYQCAEKLGLAPSTVDNHKSKLMKKLKIHKSAGLVRLAIRNGLIEA